MTAKKRHSSAIIIVALGISTLALAPMTAHAEVPSPGLDPGACVQNMNVEFARQIRLSRAVLYGVLKAENEPLGAVRYDSTARPWIKMDKNRWISNYMKGSALGDLQMDASTERDWSSPSAVRPGLLSTKYVQASDPRILAGMIQSARALQCRLRSVCAIAEASKDPQPNAGGLLSIQVDGCIVLESPPFPGCRIESQNPENELELEQLHETILNTYCQPVSVQTLERELKLMELGYAYRSAYDSLLQFAGQFEGFVSAAGSAILTPIQQTLSVLQNLQRIPCFLSQCDA